MNYQRLEKNLIDNILEAQIKLGYDGRPMSLNYTNSSLHHLTGAENIDDMLKGFSEYTQSRLGQLAFRSIKDGVCITVPSEGTAYVHENTDKNGFISRLLKRTENEAKGNHNRSWFRWTFHRGYFK